MLLFSCVFFFKYVVCVFWDALCFVLVTLLPEGASRHSFSLVFLSLISVFLFSTLRGVLIQCRPHLLQKVGARHELQILRRRTIQKPTLPTTLRQYGAAVPSGN